MIGEEKIQQVKALATQFPQSPIDFLPWNIVFVFFLFWKVILRLKEIYSFLMTSLLRMAFANTRGIVVRLSFKTSSQSSCITHSLGFSEMSKFVFSEKVVNTSMDKREI